MGALRFFFRVLTFTKIAILARILSPSQFGSYGIALVVLGFLEIVTETGVNLVLMQVKDKIDDYLDSAWGVSIVRGILISVAILATAPFISSFFNSPDSLQLLYLVSVVPLVRGFINPAIVKFQKDLQFSKEFAYRLSVFAIDTIFSVFLAYTLKSPIGIVFGLIIGVIYEIVFSFVVARPLPKFKLDLGKAAYIIRHGKWVTGYGILDYIYTQLDNMVVGKLLGEYSLGIYQNAYKISLTPVTELGDVLYRVTLPVFVKISDDKKRLLSAFIKNVVATTLLVVPAGVLIYFFADKIVLVLLGPAWVETIPAVKLLAFLGIARGVSASVNSFFVASRLQKYVVVTTLTSVLVLGVSIVPLVRGFGIMGAGVAALLGTLASIPVNVYFIRKTLANRLQVS